MPRISDSAGGADGACVVACVCSRAPVPLCVRARAEGHGCRGGSPRAAPPLAARRLCVLLRPRRGAHRYRRLHSSAARQHRLWPNGSVLRYRIAQEAQPAGRAAPRNRGPRFRVFLVSFANFGLQRVPCCRHPSRPLCTAKAMRRVDGTPRRRMNWTGNTQKSGPENRPSPPAATPSPPGPNGVLYLHEPPPPPPGRPCGVARGPGPGGFGPPFPRWS